MSHSEAVARESAALYRRGLYSGHENNRLCSVLCDSWPSWFFICPALGLHCDSVYQVERGGEWQTALEAQYATVKWFDFTNKSLGALRRRRIKQRSVYLLQCSGQVLDQLLWLFLSGAPVVACGHPEDVSFFSALPSDAGHLFELDNVACGGVIAGFWFFWISTDLCSAPPDPTQASGIPRALRHIISTTTRQPTGTPCMAPVDDSMCFPSPHFISGSSTTLDWNGPLPFARPLTKVRCPTVFDTTRWRMRGLSPLELANAFDVSASAAAVFADWPIAHRKALPFLGCAPQKLLVQGWLVGTGGGVSRSRELLVLDSPISETASILRLGETEPACEVAAYAKATKADDAEVPVHLWDNRVWALGWHNEHVLAAFKARMALPLDTLRMFLLRAWWRRLYRDYTNFMAREHGSDWLRMASASEDRKAGRECLHRACQADWWEWKAGSRLFFWRWGKAHRLAARDGYEVFVDGKLPTYMRPQPFEKDDLIVELVVKKLEKVRRLGYIDKGFIRSLTSYFSVPKGEADIRMVYDASRSGLNEALWAPNFGLPSVDVLLRGVDEGFWMGDLDIGDMFLNFMLDPKIQEYCGVDLRPYFQKEGVPGATLWERWVRCMMGLKVSPYIAIKSMLLACEIMRGDRHDRSNAYAWSKVVLNLPGSPGYDPTRPTVMRVRDSDGKMAAITVSFVDDFRAGGSSEEEGWAVMHSAASRLAYLGIQVAARKTRPPSKTPGAWAGSVVIANERGVAVKVTQEKWDKAKGVVQELKDMRTQGADLDRKRLEQHRGFLVHITNAYPALTPFLKGLHLTIDSWRPDRDSEGWKVKVSPQEEGYWCEEENQWVSYAAPGGEAPDRVKEVPRLADDIKSLEVLLGDVHPPLRFVRSKSISVALYGFGDASGVGFGSTIQTEQGVIYRYGVWGRDDESASSNFRELGNLVYTLEGEVEKGTLDQSEVYIFTDNTTAEAVFYKGNSTSRTLFELIVRLRRVEMQGRIRIKFIHIAGTRMIQQGTDALSRGDLTEGVMGNRRMMEFVPLHLGALERRPRLLAWIRGWTGDEQLEPLSPADWFERGHGISGGAKDRNGIWIPSEIQDNWLLWAPAPAACDVAVEELNLSRHKRTHLNHVFVAPRLMTSAWRKRLQKLCDLVFELPAGARPVWPREEHEPLIIGVVLRFACCSPWQVKRSQEILGMDRQLRELWKDPHGDERAFLFELCQLPRVLEAL